MRNNVMVCDHPLITHKLSYLKQSPEVTHFKDFERLIYEIGLLLTFPLTESLELEDIDTSHISSGQNWKAGKKIGQKPVLIPIVRTGLILANALREVIHTPYMGHIGLFDDQGSGDPRAFMATLPDDFINRDVVLIDLFISRGEYSGHALRLLRQMGVPPDRTNFVCLVASEEGLQKIHEDKLMKDVKFWIGRLDKGEQRWLEELSEVNQRLYRTRSRNRNVRG